MASSPGSKVSVSSIAICSVLPISPGIPLGPISPWSPFSPFGILKFKITSTGVPEFITSASSFGSIVSIFPIWIVAGPWSPFSPLIPCGPMSPFSPFGPGIPCGPIFPSIPCFPLGILKFKITSSLVPTFSTLASSKGSTVSIIPTSILDGPGIPLSPCKPVSPFSPFGPVGPITL